VRLSAGDLVSATNLLGEPLKLKKNGRAEAEIALAEFDGPIYLEFSFTR
jgi:hypothetical protein